MAQAPTLALTKSINWESVFRRPSSTFNKEPGMADPAKYSITTFQRQPGLWRASITRTDRRPCIASRTNGKEILSIVTPLDSGSEDAAGDAAKAVIRKL